MPITMAVTNTTTQYQASMADLNVTRLLNVSYLAMHLEVAAFRTRLPVVF